MYKLILPLFVFVCAISLTFENEAERATNINLIIGSFNIQSLGPTKMARPEFVETIVRIISKYDLLFIQEIKDSSVGMTVINQLVTALNNHVAARGIKYAFAISPRLGLGTYKEQLAALYRTSTEGLNRSIKIVSQSVYDDVNAVYDRPPFITKFEIVNPLLSINNFTVMSVHLRPAEVLSESLELRNVVDKYKLRTNEKNIAIVGDFNLDCTYASQVKRDAVRAMLSDFTFYISDKVPTTIAQTSSCAYDRILISGDKFNNAVLKSSNKTYRYDTEWNMPLEEVKTISDHYPVEIQLW